MVARRTRRRGWIKGGAKPPVALDMRRTPGSTARALARVDATVTDARAYIFDVEGTLIDTTLPALNCWRETLAEFGFTFTTADLHRFSGMDREAMLAQLLRADDERAVGEFILNKFYTRYRTEVLPGLRPLPGARALLARLKLRGAKIALATGADDEELAHYRGLLKADDFVDAFVCRRDGADGAADGAADVVTTALDRLGVARPDDAILVGDTPHDAEAARQARVRSLGLLSGHFARADLLGAGCVAVFLDPQELCDAIADEEQQAPAAA